MRESRTKKQLVEELERLQVRLAELEKHDGATDLEELERFFNMSQDMLCIIGVDGYFKRVNPAFETVLGHSVIELPSRPFIEFIHPEDQAATIAAIEKLAAGGTTISFVNRFHSKEGTYKRFSWKVTSIGKVLYAIVRDLTEREKAEEALLAQVHRNELILDTTMDGFILADTAGQLIDVNPAYCDLVGYSREELLTMNIEQLEGQLDATEIEHRITQMVQQGKDRFETKHKHKDGHTIDLEVSIVIMQPEETPLVAAFVRDITERKQAEEALRQNEQKFSALFEVAAHPAALSRLHDGILVNVNEAFERVFGYTKQDAVGKTAVELGINPDVSVRPRFIAMLEEHGSVRDLELELTTKSGELRITSISSDLLDIGSQKYILNTVQDITERVRAEEALKESQRRLTTLVSNLPGIAYRCHNDAQWTMEYISDGCLALTGYEVDELLHNRKISYADLIYPDDRQMVKESIQNAVNANKSFEVEYRIRTRSEEEKWVWEKGRLVHSHDATGFLEGFITDITKRKKVEEALVLSEERFRLSTELADVAVWEYDLVENNMARSPNHDQLYGLERQDRWVIQTFLNATYPDDRELSNQIIQESIQPGGPDNYGFDFRVIWPDESIHWLTVMGEVAKRDAEGSAKLVRGCLMDITDRKQAEQTLRQTEARLTEAQQIARIGSFEHHVEKDTVYWSRGLYDILGFDFHPDEPPPNYETFGSRMHPEDKAETDAQLARALADGTGPNITYRYYMPDGSMIYISAQSKVIYDASGKPEYLIGAAQDITVSKEAELALRQSEARFRALFEQAAIGVSQIETATGQFVTVNQKCGDIVGYTLDEMHQRTFQHITHPDDLQADLDNMKLLVEGKTREFSMEKRYFRKDGSIVWTELTVSPMWAPGEEPDYHIAIIQDITDRKRVEDDLTKSENRYRSLFENMNSGFVLFEVIQDRQGVPEDLVILAANERFEATTGLKIQDVIGKRLTKVLPGIENDAADWIGTYGKVAMTGESRQFEQGSELLGFHYSIAAFQAGPKLCAVTFTDISERKRAEERIERHNRELTALLDVSQQLAAQLDLTVLLNALPNHIVKTISAAEAASLWLYDAEQDVLNARAWVGHQNEVMSGLAVTPDTSLVGLVFQSGQTQFINDAADNPAFELLGKAAIDAVRSVLGVPLLEQGRPIGCLFADSFSETNAFDVTDARLLESLAGQAVIAIQNARLFDAVTRHESELRRLSTQIINAQEEERGRISRELHDEMGQALTAISINLAALEEELPPEVSSKTVARLAEINSLADQTLEQVRELALMLRPSMLDDLGLVPTLRWYVKRYVRRINVEVELEVMDLEDKRLVPEMETVLYRVAQEALTNIARHAEAKHVRIHLVHRTSMVTVSIEDDGKGFHVKEDGEPQAQGSGLGLLGIRERVTILGGSLSVRSQPGAGTQLLVELPLQ